ncbi:MAG: hypothetical protein WCO49_20655, partial [Nostocales cyanobacterium ELA608]
TFLFFFTPENENALLAKGGRRSRGVNYMQLYKEMVLRKISLKPSCSASSAPLWFVFPNKLKL